MTRLLVSIALVLAASHASATSVYRLTDFGATCDGRADDTGAWVEAAATLGRADTLLIPGLCTLDVRSDTAFPRGWLLFTSPDMTLAGETPSAAILLWSREGLPGLAFDGVTRDAAGCRSGATRVRLRGFTLQLMTPQTRGIRVFHGRGSVIDAVRFQGAAGGNTSVCLSYEGHVGGESWGNLVIDSAFVDCTVGVWWEQSTSHSQVLQSTFTGATFNVPNGLYADAWGAGNYAGGNVYAGVLTPVQIVATSDPYTNEIICRTAW